MHDMKNTQKDSQNCNQDTSRTSSTESESGSQTSLPDTCPSRAMEVQQPSVPRACTRQATFPNASPQAEVLAYPPRQMSLPACPDQESSIFGQKPLTTSQHHPPKITLLNRSPAVNLSSPTPTDSSSQPSSAEDLRVASITSFSDESLSSGIVPKPSAEDEEALSNARPPLSTDSSFDYKDSSGIDLHEFIVKTLRENPRDRLMLLKLEKDFSSFIKDETRVVYKYQQMTSYHRMLVHRVAAYFGLEHNVDQTGKCVIVNKTLSTRIPECSFKMYCSQEYTDEEISQLPRAILKRANSLEDCSTPPRPRSPPTTPKTLEDKKSRSIEEREHDYEKARARIFKDSISSHSSIDGGDIAGMTNIVQAAHEADIALASSRQSSVPPRFQDWSEQRNAEREAAIAAAAAATGGNVKLKKRLPGYDQGRLDLSQRQDMIHSQPLSSLQSMYSPEMQMAANQGVMGPGLPVSAQGLYVNAGQDGFSPGSVWINPVTGQPMAGHDASQVVYPHGYSAGRQGGVLLPAQQMPPSVSHQAPYPYLMPVQYGAGGPQPHYYVVNHPQGERTTVQPVQTGTSPLPGASPSPAVSYQDISSQMTALALSQRHADNTDEDVASTDSYSTTPTPPPGNQMDVPYQMMVPGGSPYMIIPPRQMMPGHVYQNPVPLQYVAGHGYAPYSPYAQYVAVPEMGSRYPPSQTPPVQPRSPSPVMVGPPYIANPMQPHMSHPGRGQTPPYTRTPPPTTSPFLRNTVPAQVPGGTMIFPVQHSVSNVQHSVPPGSVTPPTSSSPYQNWKGQGSKRSSKGTNGMSNDILHYQALAQEGYRVQQNIASLSGQSRQPVKMVHVPPHFTMMPGQRFHQPQTPYNQLMGSQYKRGKPKVQSRAPRQNMITTTVDDNKKTVNHILEVYDMPEGLSPSEIDALLKDLEDAGGHILRINNSSAGSSQTAAGPAVLAIFKSATDAQNALETVNNPKFKLRVSQKSPTHFSADDSATSRSSSTSSS